MSTSENNENINFEEIIRELHKIAFDKKDDPDEFENALDDLSSLLVDRIENS